MPSKGKIIAEAVRNAGIMLNLTPDELRNILGVIPETSLEYIEPTSRVADMAAQFIRCYQNLYNLVGGKPEDMQCWLHTENKAFNNQIPKELIQTPDGLNRMLNYLEGMMNKH